MKVSNSHPSQLCPATTLPKKSLAKATDPPPKQGFWGGRFCCLDFCQFLSIFSGKFSIFTFITIHFYRAPPIDSAPQKTVAYLANQNEYSGFIFRFLVSVCIIWPIAYAKNGQFFILTKCKGLVI